MVRKAEMPKSVIEVNFPKTPEEIASWIAVAAYYKAKERGFTPGHEIEDWIEAERELATQAELKTVTLNQ